MTREELAKEIALGLINTGVESGFDGVSCSTAGDYPSLGCSQWEGSRANRLLGKIPGGDKFIGRAYSDIEAAGELDELSALLDSPEGQQAQVDTLVEDTLFYVDALQEIASLDQSRCLIYAAMWCPTSLNIVKIFLQRREARSYDLRSLDVLRDLFRDQYAAAADCMDYADGYTNRANTTYDYVAALDLSVYGEE